MTEATPGRLVFFFVLFFPSYTVGNPVVNVTLDALKLGKLTNGLNVVQSTRIYIHCTEEQKIDGNYQLYNLKQDEYGTCTKTNANKVIGNCHNTPLSIDVKELSITLGDLVSYEVGETYYNGVFRSDSRQPCEDGLKFFFNVVSSLAEEVTTSSVVPAPPPSPSPSPSTPLIQSTSASSSVVHSSSSPMPNIKSSSSVSTIASTRGNIVTRPVRPSSTVATRPTEITRPTADDPVVDGVRDGSPSSSSVSFLLMVLLVLSIPLFHRLL